MNRRGFLQGLLGLTVGAIAGPAISALAARMPEVVTEPESNVVFAMGSGADFRALQKRSREQSFVPRTWYVSPDMARELRSKGISL